MANNQETRIAQALQALAAKAVPSIRKAAELFDVPKSTLYDRTRGILPHKNSHQSAQRLSIEEEAAIERTILQMAAWGWPMTINSLETLATQLLHAKSDTTPLGKNWYLKFFARHPGLKTIRSRALDQSRKDATTEAILQHWFDLFQTTRLTYNVADEDIYNMDEKGVMKGIGDKAKVIVSRQEKEAFMIQPGNREWVSIIECIGYNRYVLPPFIIFEGERIQHSWIPKSIDPRTVIQVSPKGWTDQSIALAWLQHFNQHTKAQTRGDYRLLILDGHSSHVSIDFVQYCEDNKIIPLCLPPNSTHVLQPLDVGIFGPLSKAYKALISRNSVFGATRIDNAQFLQHYHNARHTIRANIPGAWRGTGLIPFNPSKILLRHRPKTPPFAILTDESGRRVDIPVAANMSQRINSLAEELFQVCPTPMRPKLSILRHTCLTAIADNQCFQVLNNELVEKQRQARARRNGKHHGLAKKLTTQELWEEQAERETKEAKEQKEKERRALLEGKVGFVKLVWKELRTDVDVFD